jgi:hypothetical protein
MLFDSLDDIHTLCRDLPDAMAGAGNGPNLAGRPAADYFRWWSRPREPRMMRTAIVKTVLLAALVCAFALPPAQAEVRILASPGGQVGPFLDLFERVRASGERVVIDGPCLSACTLVLSVVPDDRICVTRRAILGFHAARSMDRRGRMYAEPEASELVLEAYPSAVRGWIRRRGGLSSRLLLLRGRELAAIYPSCR